MLNKNLNKGWSANLFPDLDPKIENYLGAVILLTKADNFLFYFMDKNRNFTLLIDSSL